MLREKETCHAIFLGGYKLNFMKYLDNVIRIYDTYIHFEGITLIDDNKVNERTTSCDIDLRDIKSVEFSEFKKQKCLVVTYTYDSLVGNKKDKLYFFDLNGYNGNFDDCKEMISKAVNNHLEKIRKQYMKEMEQQKELQRQKEEAKKFYNECLEFHLLKQL